MTHAAPIARDSFVVDQLISSVSWLISGYIYPRGGSKKDYRTFVADLLPKYDADGNPYYLPIADPELFELVFNTAYNRFFHINQDVDNDDNFDYTDYSMRQGERGM